MNPQSIAAVGLLAYSLGTLFYLPSLVRDVRSVRGAPLKIAVCWTLMFVGLGVYFVRSSLVKGLDEVDSSAKFQIVCFGIASLIVLQLVGKGNALRHLKQHAVFWLFAYGIQGVLSASYSANPTVSLYKAALVVFDAVLIAVAIFHISKVRGADRFLYNLTIFLVSMLVAGALLGGVIWPVDAYRPSKGIFGVILQGTLPWMNSNGLGFLSAVTLVVALRRSFERVPLQEKLYWAGLFVAGGVTLVLSQARTGLAAVALAIFFMAYWIPRMRVTAVVLALLITCFFIAKGEALQTVVAYAQRGQKSGGFQTLIDRYEVWKDVGGTLFSASPIVGHGFDTGDRYTGELYFGRMYHMHNSHIEILTNSGVVGYFLWLSMVICVLVQARRLFRMHRPVVREGDRFVVETMAVIIVILLRTITGSVLATHQWSLMIFLSILAVAMIQFESDLHMKKHGRSSAMLSPA